MSSFIPPPGTSDIFPDEIYRWENIKNSADNIFSLYGYGEIRTPIFEYTEVFQKSIGSETEVVKKEMYTFEDRGGRSLTLRPEGTAGVMRALMKTDAPNGGDVRVYYLGPMFRGERPAAGRKRQFHQIGVESVGKIGPEFDAECITMLAHYLRELKITGAKILINTRGTAEDRGPAEKALRDYFLGKIENMCTDCQERINNNVWRILDCKSMQCQEHIINSPKIRNLFSQNTQDYFVKVVEILTKHGIDFSIEDRLVRGLDYYEHTVFEITHDGLGGQNAIAGGGRYRISVPGSNKPLIGVGFAAGVERLIMVQDVCHADIVKQKKPAIFIASLGYNAKLENMKLALELRRNNIPVVIELEDKSMKSQMRSAGKFDIKAILTRGDSELEKNTVVLKNLNTGEQKEIAIINVVEEVKTLFKA